MSPAARNLLITCSVLFLVICLCLSIFAIGAAGFLAVRSVGSNNPQPTAQADISPAPRRPTATPAPSPTAESPAEAASPTSKPGQATPLPPESATPQAQEALPADVLSQMEEIQDQVSELRGLQPSGTFGRALLTPQQLRQHVLDNFLKDYTPEEARQDGVVLSAFGLLESDFDLLKFYEELLSEQVAGYYDDETKEMYVVKGEGFQGVERMTYAHEYAHALQDQTYDIENGLQYNDDTCEEDTERCAAIQALLEGDASLVEETWLFTHATSQDMQQIMEFYGSYTSPVYDSAPPFMQEDFLFPYTAGKAFVDALYEQGGWESIDAAYRNVPVSTEQILHPEKYPDDRPAAVEVPDLVSALGDGWSEIDRNVLGEWYTYLLLGFGIDPDTQLGQQQAQQAADGWGGDTYVVWHNEQTGQTVLVLSSTWDSASDARQFSQAFREYADARFGAGKPAGRDAWTWDSTGAASRFSLNGSQAAWVLAPDAAVLQTVVEALQTP
jgi:hypothetical protein